MLTAHLRRTSRRSRGTSSWTTLPRHAASFTASFVAGLLLRRLAAVRCKFCSDLVLCRSSKFVAVDFCVALHFELEIVIVRQTLRVCLSWVTTSTSCRTQWLVCVVCGSRSNLTLAAQPQPAAAPLCAMKVKAMKADTCGTSTRASAAAATAARSLACGDQAHSGFPYSAVRRHGKDSAETIEDSLRLFRCFELRLAVCLGHDHVLPPPRARRVYEAVKRFGIAIARDDTCGTSTRASAAAATATGCSRKPRHVAASGDHHDRRRRPLPPIEVQA